MDRNALIKKLTISGLSILLAAIILLSAGCGKAAVPYVKTSFALDTVVQVTVYDEKDEAAALKALEYCKDAEKIFSMTDPSSELYRLNASAGTPVRIPEELYSLLLTCQTYGRLSDGAFDVTLGALSSVYAFSGDTHRVPDDEERAALLSHTGPDKLTLSDNGTALVSPGTVIDLGAAAKGRIADGMKALLLSEGVRHAIVNLGGNVLVIGEKPSGNGTVPFDAGIAKPVPGQTNEVLLNVPLSDASLVTSGTYQRYFEQDGVRYHHILDPATGLPVSNGLASVSVICEKSEDADILSTACFVLGEEKAAALIRALDFPVEVIFVNEQLEISRIRN